MTSNHEHPNSHSNGHSCGPVPADLAAVDRLAKRALAEAVLSGGSMPPGLVDRVFVASRGVLRQEQRLELPVDVVARLGDRRRVGVPSSRVRWARLSLAAAAAIAVAASTTMVLRAPVAPSAPTEFVAALPAAPADEAMLVALLDGTSSPSSWVDDNVFGRSPFAQEVAPVIRSLDTDVADVVSELQAVFQANLGAGL